MTATVKQGSYKYYGFDRYEVDEEEANFFVNESGLLLQSSESVLKKKYMYFKKKRARGLTLGCGVALGSGRTGRS